MEREWGRLSVTRKIGILRLSHRHFRDQRMTTHVALSSRAFGCTSFAYTGEKDENLEKSLRDIVERWGGEFTVEYVESYRKYINNWKGQVVHLSMYGEDHRTTLRDLREFEEENLLIIVGGPKVPPPVYELSDYNTAIGHQPHSEIAAISVFLTDLLGSEVLYRKFPGAKVDIPPGLKAGRSKARSGSGDKDLSPESV